MERESQNDLENEVYVYDPLEHASSHIRLLTLFPSCEKSAPLRGEICTLAMPSERIYEALSYVWGDQPSSSCLWVDGKRLSLSFNLSQALIHLRRPKEARTLWIDAVCIDQGNPEEKSHQVQQMYTIFSTAYRVIIWLGESDADSDYAMEHLGRLHAPDVDLVRVGKIFDRPWWTRIWTLQEGLVANKDSLAMCGYKVAPWETIIQLISSLLQVENVYRSGKLPISPVLQYFSRVRSLRDEDKEVNLEDLIFMSTTRQASDPRDYIFALLGLLTRPSRYSLTPDYSEPALCTYQKATADIFKLQGNLDFLLCETNRTEPGVLSWCVDFSKRHLLWSFDPQSLYYRYDSEVETGATTGREMTTLSHDIYTGRLTLSGTIVGTIESTQDISGRTTQLTNKEERMLMSHEQEGEHFVPNEIATFLYGMLIISALCLRIWKSRLGPTAARSKLDQGDVWKLAAGGRPFKELLNKPSNEAQEGYAVMTDLAKRGAKQLAKRTLGVPNAQVQHAMLGYRRIYGQYGVNARIFGTDTNYVGSGSGLIEIGDYVCIIFGCRLPLILRPYRHGTYRIIDSAYVDSIMNGEFLESQTSDMESEFVIE